MSFAVPVPAAERPVRSSRAREADDSRRESKGTKEGRDRAQRASRSFSGRPCARSDGSVLLATLGRPHFFSQESLTLDWRDTCRLSPLWRGKQGREGRRCIDGRRGCCRSIFGGRGVSKSELSRRFGVGRRTIHHWTTTGQLYRDLAARATRPAPRKWRSHNLDPYKPMIDARLEAFPKLSAQRLFDDEWSAGHPGGYGRVRDHVGRWRPQDPVEPVGAKSRLKQGIRREFRNDGLELCGRYGPVPRHLVHHPRLRPEAGLKASRLPPGRSCSSLAFKTCKRDRNAKGSDDRCAAGAFARLAAFSKRISIRKNAGSARRPSVERSRYRPFAPGALFVSGSAAGRPSELRSPTLTVWFQLSRETGAHHEPFCEPD